MREHEEGTASNPKMIECRTESQNSDHDGAARGALLASGFPLQTAVARAIKKTEGWSVVAEEWPWQDTDRTDQFMDVIATNDRCVLTIECKKTRKEVLVFLQPSGTEINQTVSRALCIFSSQGRDSTRRLILFGGEWHLSPASGESMYCVVGTSQGGRDQRLLEPDARRLIYATDAYARHRRSNIRDSGGIAEPNRPYVPLIVTTAQLFLAFYRPSDISLETGEFDKLPDPITRVDWIRFRKAFSSESVLTNRTVFVVRANALTSFLSRLEIDAEPPREAYAVPYE